jgi:parvulin-like peptidyl-prolyl isomerase
VKDPAYSPAQIAQFKERMESIKKSNLTRLEQPEKVRVSHVFFTTRDRKTEEPLPDEQKKFKRQQLEKIRQKALAGEDFAKLVQQFSEDRGLKETKGEYTLSREDRFVPEFKAAAFSLETGKISDIVTSDLGLHIIKLLEKIPAKKAEFEKVAPDLKEFLTQQEVQRMMPEYFGRLSKEAGLEILDPKYKLEIADDSEPKKAGN